jgi:hypothetical protein
MVEAADPIQESQAQPLRRGTGGAGFHPGFDQRAGLRLRAGSAAEAGMPGPAEQLVGGMSSSTLRPPLRAGSLSWAQISASVLPSQAISRGACVS